jgi:sortase A
MALPRPRTLAHARRRPGVRNLVIGALALLGSGLLIAGMWIPVKAELAQHLLDRAWSAARDQGTARRPWPWADTWPVARLTLPTSATALTVLAGASGRNLAFGPALMDGSAMPGVPGVSVIAGHRDTHFRELGKLELGDHFTVEMAYGAAYAYEVTSIDVLDADRALLRLDGDESVVVLVTCYPFEAVVPGGNLRYVVTGQRVLETTRELTSSTVF